MRKVLFITGTRAEYGLMRPVLRAINESDGLSIALAVTGMHLSKEFGFSVKEIEKDNFPIIAKLPLLHREDTLKGMSKYLGKLVFHLTDIAIKLKPDFVLINGDRDEALAGAIVGSHLNIPVVHLHGGERTGTLDEFMRHAITKLSHLHLCATQESKKRIIKLGEEPFRVHVVGAPALDVILKKEFTSKEETMKKFRVQNPTLLVVQHPVTTEFADAESQIKETLEAVAELGIQTIIIYPNADAGGRRMINVIEEHNRYPFIQAYRNLSQQDYFGLLNTVNVLIGNSSSGIIEAPLFKIPVVNIGTRQNLRERSNNVIDVPYNKTKIRNAITKALHDKKFLSRTKRCKSAYGDGHAAERVVSILSIVKIDNKLIQKQLTY